MTNNNNNMAYQRLFRIQGGIEPSRSREYLTIVNDTIKASRWKAVYIGDLEHMLFNKNKGI